MAKATGGVYDFEKDGYRHLFLEWLLEWKQEAASQQSRIQYTYANAHKSLKNYPMPVYSGHGCIKLSYFGDHTCKKLEKKLTTYLKENKLQRISGSDPFLPSSSSDLVSLSPRKMAGKKSPKKKSADSLALASSETDDAQSTVPPKKAPRKRAATKKKPAEDDVVTIEETDTLPPLPVIQPALSLPLTGSRSVQEILRPSTSSRFHSQGSASSDVPSTARSTSSSSSSVPGNGPAARPNGLVFTRGVTTSVIGGGGGFSVRTCSSEELTVKSASQSGASRFDNIPLDEFTFFPGSFDVVLCVDNQEIHSKGNTRSKLDIVAELKKQSLYFSVRSLKAGDFLWIAQEKEAVATREKRKQRELVLDFIAERKRGDDLAVSIKDGRYTCQKFRMKTASLRRVIYIIEDASRFQNKGLSDQAFHQALANIEIQDGFIVKETDNLSSTADYLVMMTNYLQRAYSKATLKSCSYSQRGLESGLEFNFNRSPHNLLSFTTFSAVAKTNQAKTVSQAFLLHLLALDGVSPAKASAIVTKYPTVRRLTEAYDACTVEQERETLLRDIRFGSGITKIGPTISKKLYNLYCTSGALI